MLAILVLAQTLAAAPATQKLTIQEYAIDAGHSIVEFSVGFAFSHVKGRFPQTHGTILYDPAAPERSSVSVVIETRSLDTGWGHRDEHLRTVDFFDVEKYPTITFQSTSVSRSGDSWIATGPFTMHGVTRTIAIPFRFVAPPSRRPESGWMVFNAAGELKLARTDFGILGGATHNSWFNAARAATVSDTVEVSLEIEGFLPDAASQRPKVIEDRLESTRTSGIATQVERLRQIRATKSDAEFAAYFHGADLLVRGLIADGRVREAVTLSRALTEMFPTLASAWLVHGFAIASSGDARAAAQQYARAKEVFQAPVVDPNEKFPQVDEYWYYNDQLVRAALEWGRLPEAVGLARAVADMYGTAPRAHVSLGLALALSGDTVGARAAYARALQLDSSETRALEWQRRLKS